MQTQTLPIQVSGASANPAPQRATGVANGDNAQFSQALSREMEQRQNSPAPAPARQAAPAAKQQATPTPNSEPAPAQAKLAEGKPAEGKPAEAKPADAGAEETGEDAVDTAAASPVADMLALVASFNQPVTVTTAPAGNPLAAAAAAATASVDLAKGYAGMPAKSDSDPAALAADGKAQAPAMAADGKAQALAPAADDTGLALKDLAQTIDGAARFSMKAPAGGAEPSGAQSAVSALRAGPAGAAQQSDRDGVGAAAVKADARTEAAGAAQLAPLRTRESVADAAVLKDMAAPAPVTVPVQQASLAMAQATSGVPTDKIAARVGAPGWDNQVAQKIVWMVAGKEQSASLTLNPPDMGPMQVVLSVTNDQATVTFSAAQPEVRQALENAMPKLREMMGESGIALGNATVNDGSQRQAQHGEQQRGQGAGGRFGGAATETSIAADTPRQADPGTTAGMVDTFA